MKTTKNRHIKSNDGSRKSILKFKDTFNDEFYGDEKTTGSKKRKNVGKRFHRKKSAKYDFLDNELRSINMR